jgi:hypothetical protein
VTSPLKAAVVPFLPESAVSSNGKVPLHIPRTIRGSRPLIIALHRLAKGLDYAYSTL